MTKIEELIKELCPNGVEYKELGEVCEDKFWIMPSTPKFTNNQDIPYITSKNIRGGIINFKDVKYISQYDYLRLSKNRPIIEGDILISMIGTIGEVAKVRKKDLSFYGQNMYLIRLKTRIINNDYFLHFFDSDIMKKHLNSVKNKSSQGYLRSNDIEIVQIPIPPIEVQEEIVIILDKFSALEAELEAELEARKKQYTHYRDSLLSFNDDTTNSNNITWKTLGEIGEFIRGNGLQKKDFVESGFPCIHYGQIYTYYGNFAYKTKSFVSEELSKKLKKVKTGDLIVAITSENIEDVCKAVVWLGKGEIVTGGHSAIFKHNQNPKYIAYLFQTSMFFEQKKRLARGTKVIDISPKDLQKISIPIPPIAEQERIVAILDKFDALVNDLSSGLPAEIKARRQQYEYYRDKLLNFPKMQ